MGYNKIILNGGQTCDYLYMQTKPVQPSDFYNVDSEPDDWNNSTVMFSAFNDDLVAGNSSLKSRVDGYELRRRKGTNASTEHIANIKDGGVKYIIDYMAASNTPYTYYLYPTLSDDKTALSPFISEEVKGNWDYWSLIIVDESDEENVFYLNKLFKFELNISTDDMSNNAQISVSQTFTEYPKVQYSTSNYWSGGLTALCGYITCDTGEYIQTPNMIDELKGLTSDTRRKFLKTPDGHIWEVKITSPIGISLDDTTYQYVKSVKIGWTEVGEIDGISITNNPNGKIVSWLLTETGEAKPYIDYVWDNDSVWDDDYKWTARDDILETEVSNMGRALYGKDGDE